VSNRVTAQRKAYNLGWAAGVRGNPTALENADDRGVSRDWYDGFFDATCNETKYTNLKETTTT
jgi:hypothetical protein